MRFRRVLAEYVGTILLALGICLREGSPYAAGGCLWAAIIGTGFVSGAQFNPAITTSIIIVGVIKRRLTKEDLFEHFIYYICHFLGATTGALLAWAIRSETFEMAPQTEPIHAYLAEMVATSNLILVAMIGGELRDSFFIGTLAVAVTLFAGIFTTGPISGGCLNPAVGLGANWTDAMNHGYVRAQYLYIYLLGPLTGSLIAAVFYLMVHNELVYFYNMKDRLSIARDADYSILTSF